MSRLPKGPEVIIKSSNIPLNCPPFLIELGTERVSVSRFKFWPHRWLAEVGIEIWADP